MAAWHLGKMGPSHVSDPLDWGVACGDENDGNFNEAILPVR